MTRKHQDAGQPLGRFDRWVNRGLAIAVLLVAAVLTYSLVFTPFDERVRFQWDVTPDGGRTPMTHVTCPSPWSVLVNDAEPEVMTTEGLCVMPSRVLVVEGTIVVAIALVPAIWLLTRTRRPEPMHELPVAPNRKREGVEP